MRRFGSICDTDDWCQREDSNLICDDNYVCSCMDGFAVAPDSKSTVCTAGEGFMYFDFPALKATYRMVMMLLLYGQLPQQKTKHLNNIWTTTAQGLRRWPSILQILYK